MGETPKLADQAPALMAAGRMSALLDLSRYLNELGAAAGLIDMAEQRAAIDAWLLEQMTQLQAQIRLEIRGGKVAGSA